MRARRFLALGLVAGALAGCGGDEPASAPPAGPGALVWAVGDGADGGSRAKAVAAQIARDRPERVLYLGDVYEQGTPEEFRDHFASVYGSLARRMAPTPGNHEWARRAEGYDPYWRRMKGRPLRHWYAFSLGGWRVLSLNSQDPANRAQLAFARRELARARGTCVLAFWHRPRFNAGEHEEEEADVQPLWQAVRGRVALILSGHDHNLQRFRPVAGAVQYVVGAGGHSHYDVDEDDERLAFSRDDADGALRMRLAPGVARLSFVTAEGDELDRTTVRCR